MSKHAYLILAHGNWTQLSRLMELIDDERNDIFLHIDKKSRFDSETKQMLIDSTKKSNLIFVDRIDVCWGSFSMIKAEMVLLQTAVQTQRYAYYHLISGSDLPLKSQNEIHSYFDEAQGEEFLSCSTKEWSNKISYRIKYYWFFQNFAGHSKRLDKQFLKILDRMSVQIQKILGINRLQGMEFIAGAQWFSITHELAEYIIGQSQFIKEHFKNGLCADEGMIQTMAIGAGYEKRIHATEDSSGNLGNARYVDWERGTPYVFREEDYDLLMSSNCMFARKFDENIDNDIISKIYSTIMEKRA